MDYPSPCDTCTQVHCHSRNCVKWRIRYMRRQAQINAYAKHHGIVPGSPEYSKGKNPCKDCARNEECTSICKSRARYWDECLQRAQEKRGITT